APHGEELGHLKPSWSLTVSGFLRDVLLSFDCKHGVWVISSCGGGSVHPWAIPPKLTRISTLKASWPCSFYSSSTRAVSGKMAHLVTSTTHMAVTRMMEVAFFTLRLLTSILTWSLLLLWCSHSKISSSSLSLIPIIPTSVPVLIIRPPLVSSIFPLLKSSILDSISGQIVRHAHSTLNSSWFRGSNMWLDLGSQTLNVAVDTLVL
ncbi:hypothetical protein Tco_1464581, partial [Tanacetum coccineum]